MHLRAQNCSAQHFSLPLVLRENHLLAVGRGACEGHVLAELPAHDLRVVSAGLARLEKRVLVPLAARWVVHQSSVLAHTSRLKRMRRLLHVVHAVVLLRGDLGTIGRVELVRVACGVERLVEAALAQVVFLAVV